MSVSLNASTIRLQDRNDKKKSNFSEWVSNDFEKIEEIGQYDHLDRNRDEMWTM